MAEETKSKKIELVKNWLKRPENLALSAILLFTVIIRLFYFFLTINQAVWWDEASYGTLAYNMIDHRFQEVPTLAREFVIRPPLLPFIWSLFIRLGLSEAIVRFFLLIIPSIISVLLVYYISKELSNKKIALISTAIFSGLWITLFYSMRLLTETLALLFCLLSIYFFIKSYKKDFPFLPFLLSLFFLSLSIIARYPFGIVGIVYLAFIVLTGKIRFFAKKSFLASGFLGGLVLILFFLYNYIKSGSLLPAAGDYAAGFSQVQGWGFYILGYIPHYLQTTLLAMFLLGVLVCVYELIIGYGVIRKTERLQGYLFILLLLAFTLGFFIFITKSAEDRYLFICLLSFLFLCALGIESIYNLILKYNKNLALLAVIAVLAFGMYSQISFADSMIKSKAESYAPMKEAFLWIKDNLGSQNLLVAYYADLYSLYYSGKIPYEIASNETEFEKQIQELKPLYLVVHVFNPQPDYIYTYPEQHPDEFKIEKVFYLAPENPGVIIYKVQ